MTSEAMATDGDRAADRRDDSASQWKVFVGGISWQMDDRALKELFEPYGAVDAVVMMDKLTKRSRGFGFVTFADKSGMEEAIAEKHDTDMEGRKISVRSAIPESDIPPEQRGRDRGRPAPGGGYGARGGGYGDRSGGYSDRYRGGGGYDSRGGYSGGYDRYGGGGGSYSGYGGGYGGGYDRDPYYGRDPYAGYGGGGYDSRSGGYGGGYDSRSGGYGGGYDSRSGGYGGGYGGGYDARSGGYGAGGPDRGARAYTTAARPAPYDRPAGR